MNATFDLPRPFDMLPPEHLRRLALVGGATLFRQGDPTRAIFLITAGAVRLVRHTEAGRRVVLFRARPGDTLAEPALFSDTYHCDAVAETDSTLTAIDRATVLRHLARDGAFATALVQRLAQQVQTYRRRLELLAIRPAKARVLAALADGWLTGPVTDLAADLGLTHEVVYRALAELCAEGRAERIGRGRYRAVGKTDSQVG